MEDILHLYSLPVDEQRPVVCFDELPVQLLGEVVVPLAMKAGAPERIDYEYERGGVCSLLVAFEPLSGKRLVETSRQRTKADYCRFMHRVNTMFPAATKIVRVQDNLNTHHASSFYENLPAAEAFALAQKFEMHYTPKKGSWRGHRGVGTLSTLTHLYGATYLDNGQTGRGDTRTCQRTK